MAVAPVQAALAGGIPHFVKGESVFFWLLGFLIAVYDVGIRIFFLTQAIIRVVAEKTFIAVFTVMPGLLEKRFSTATGL